MINTQFNSPIISTLYELIKNIYYIDKDFCKDPYKDFIWKVPAPLFAFNLNQISYQSHHNSH